VAWEVEFTDEFEQWWNNLSEEEQTAVAAKVRLLEEKGTESTASPLFRHSELKTPAHA